MNERKRIDWIDVAKGIGILLVIISHVEEHFVGTPNAILKGPIYTFHMPLFFFVSGYLFSMKGSFKEFFKNKCKRILLPYFCLGTILVLFDIYWQGKNPYGNPWFKMDKFLGGMLNLLYQCRFWTLWFIACLFFLNILLYIIMKCSKNEKVRAGIVVVLAILGLTYYKIGGGGIFWNIDVCLTTMPFFYGGYLCRKTDFINSKILKNRYKWALFAGFVAADVVCYIVNLRMTGQFLELWGNQYGFAPLTYVGAFAGTFALIILADACRGFFPLRYLGENTMLIYAWHQTMMIPIIQKIFIVNDLFQGVWLTPAEYVGRIVVATAFICISLSIVNEILCRLKLGFVVGK